MKAGKHRGFIYLDKSVFVDTRSVSAMGSLTTENIGNCNLMMVAECTAELRLGKKRFREYELNRHCPKQVQVGA